MLAHAGATVPPRIDGIFGDYTGSDRDLVAGLYPALKGYQATPDAFLGYLRGLARDTLIRMAADDAPQPDAGLATALGYLVAQMQASSATVKRATVGVAVAPGTNTGDGVLTAAPTLRTGLPAENVFAETLTATIAADAQGGGATAGRETLAVRGRAAAPSSLAPAWPKGSGASVTLTAVDAAQAGAGGTANWLADGTFEGPWTANVPAGWAVDVGTAGTTILRATTPAYAGAASLQLAGTGTELTSVSQTLPATGAASARPLDVLAFNLWVDTAGTPAAGTLEVALTDGAGAVVADAAGTPNATTHTLVGLTGWTAVSGYFRTPRVLPAALRLRLRLSVALPAGTSAFLDRVALARPVQPYPQSFYCCLFSGVTPLVVGDSWTLTATNDRGGVPASFQTYFDRLFNMRSLGYLLPSAATPTVDDATLIA